MITTYYPDLEKWSANSEIRETVGLTQDQLSELEKAASVEIFDGTYSQRW